MLRWVGTNIGRDERRRTMEPLMFRRYAVYIWSKTRGYGEHTKDTLGPIVVLSPLLSDRFKYVYRAFCDHGLDVEGALFRWFKETHPDKDIAITLKPSDIWTEATDSSIWHECEYIRPTIPGSGYAGGFTKGEVTEFLYAIDGRWDFNSIAALRFDPALVATPQYINAAKLIRASVRRRQAIADFFR
jgi:hypothetical protein